MTKYNLIEVEVELSDSKQEELFGESEVIKARKCFLISQITTLTDDPPDGGVYIGLKNGDEIFTKSVTYNKILGLWYDYIESSRA